VERGTSNSCAHGKGGETLGREKGDVLPCVFSQEEQRGLNTQGRKCQKEEGPTSLGEEKPAWGDLHYSSEGIPAALRRMDRYPGNLKEGKGT